MVLNLKTSPKISFTFVSDLHKYNWIAINRLDKAKINKAIQFIFLEKSQWHFNVTCANRFDYLSACGGQIILED